MKVLLINPWGGEVFPTPATGHDNIKLLGLLNKCSMKKLRRNGPGNTGLITSRGNCQ
jgi:hypothetical protein